MLFYRPLKGIKVSVDAGHCATGQDISSNGYINEYAHNIVVKNLVIQKLQSLGALVKDCSLVSSNKLIRSLEYRVNTSNSFGAKVHLCIHANCFDNPAAHGAEVEYYSNEGAKLAQCIQNEFVKLGYTDRKIQKRDNLYILKYTNAVCVLTEGFFVSNKADCSKYNAVKEADAIVKGLVNYLKTK